MKPIIHREFKQHSEEWYAIRKTRLGSSNNVLAVKGKRADGLGVAAVGESYRIAANVMGWYDEDEEGFTSDAMEAGNEYEPYARDWYEQETFQEVEQVGYVSLGKYFGYSPDGLIGNDGLQEIKCPQGKEFSRFAITRQIQKDYINQMQWALFITGRKWCDFVCYNQYTDTGIIHRVEPDEALHDKFSSACSAFEKLVEENLRILKETL